MQSPAAAELAGREAIQNIVLFPQQIQRGWHDVPKQALPFTAAGVIQLIASIWPEGVAFEVDCTWRPMAGASRQGHE